MKKRGEKYKSVPNDVVTGNEQHNTRQKNKKNQISSLGEKNVRIQKICPKFDQMK